MLMCRSTMNVSSRRSWYLTRRPAAVTLIGGLLAVPRVSRLAAHEWQFGVFSLSGLWICHFLFCPLPWPAGLHKGWHAEHLDLECPLTDVKPLLLTYPSEECASAGSERYASSMQRGWASSPSLRKDFSHIFPSCFFFFFFFYWGIAGLYCCVRFRCSAKWFSHTCTCIRSFSESFPV